MAEDDADWGDPQLEEPVNEDAPAPKPSTNGHHAPKKGRAKAK